MTVPQTGHLPLMALRPFFIVSSTPSAISRLALHLTQYPSAIKTFAARASCPNGKTRVTKLDSKCNLEKKSPQISYNKAFATVFNHLAERKALAKSNAVGYTHFMIITADSRRRVTLPKPAHPGDAFDLEKTGHGQFLLTRLEKPSRKITLSRKNGFLVANSGRRITMAETRELMNQFP